MRNAPPTAPGPRPGKPGPRQARAPARKPRPRQARPVSPAPTPPRPPPADNPRPRRSDRSALAGRLWPVGSVGRAGFSGSGAYSRTGLDRLARHCGHLTHPAKPDRNDGPPLLLLVSRQRQRWVIDVAATASMGHRCPWWRLSEQHRWAIDAVAGSLEPQAARSPGWKGSAGSSWARNLGVVDASRKQTRLKSQPRHDSLRVTAGQNLLNSAYVCLDQ